MGFLDTAMPCFSDLKQYPNNFCPSISGGIQDFPLDFFDNKGRLYFVNDMFIYGLSKTVYPAHRNRRLNYRISLSAGCGGPTGKVICIKAGFAPRA